jgi:hypothetical protein
MLDLQTFANEPFLIALRQLFVSLRIPVNYISELPADAADILGEHYRPAHPAQALIQEVYALGVVDDAAFENPTQTHLPNLTADYDGILIFGVMLKSPFGGNRGLLADITRAFNRAFPHLPVVVVFRYGHFISIANAERLSYLQNWREGEKIGKVSLLKDIDIVQPHAGHLRILDSLRISSTGRYAVTNFAQMYYYWQSVFSISVLNKSFYQEIIKWFEEAVQTIKIPSENNGSEKHKDFSVRLIARFIFIWFLKELGVVKKELLTLNWENGLPNEFINPKSTGSAYYKFILQNLFFNVLNCEQKDRNSTLFDIYADYFTDVETLKEWIFFSPYLNGGLFDIHPNDWCSENDVNNAFVVPDSLFLDPKQGLIALLGRYKFTIAENTPVEEEIAVDPEMLGRIFENLLAEQSDDTKEAARKNAGAFYTPRPVVAYMCRSTLLKHLDTDISPKKAKEIIHKILETTVLDPACGSGAFPMGMLEEMMLVLNTVDPHGKIWTAEMMKSRDENFRNHIAEMFADGQINYVKKLGILRNCLFGIDLLEYAIEITKLRCWLSLIVEQKVDFSLPNYNLKPLPNLEFKFYKKNSLYRFYKNQNLNKLIEEIDN